ncbi:C-type lectin domain family 17, member A-like [Argopecten irradians]|uniref:C-type lectin domain family 17, member A-like n=1 Tax=Argopecten irradians TaxID=31199 RepID=UPI00371AD095
MSCYMFEFFPLISVCHVFSGVAPSNSSTINFSMSRKVHKEMTNCYRSGYTFDTRGSICFKIVNRRRSWNEAKDACIKDEGRLLVLSNTNQVNAIRKAMRSASIRFVFVGLTDAATEGRWIWVDGSRLDRHIWSKVALNNYDDYPGDTDADCAVLSSSNTLMDMHCNNSFPYICERPQLLYE